MPRKKLRRDTVVDVVALQGPTGTLDGDVRALLAAITERKTYELRRQRLTKLLAQIEKDSSLKHRRAVVRALWPSVQKLIAHRTELAVMETARAEDRRAKWTTPDAAIAYLDMLRVHYWPLDAIREPVEAAQLALRRFQRLPTDEQSRLLGTHVMANVPRNLKMPGQSWLRQLNADTRAAIEKYVDEDDSVMLRRLVGLIHLPV